MTLSDFDASALDPDQFAATVKAATKSQLEELMSGEHRKAILDTVFNRLPSRFRADRAGTTDAVVHWHITGPAGTDSYEVTIGDGACTTGAVTVADPKLGLTLGGPDFLALIAGSSNPTMMFMTGKLKVKGDPMLAAGIANLFDFPKG